MNKKTIAAALSTTLLGLSTAASAAVSHGNLTFTFSGNIPALPVAGTGWGFFNADGTAYTAPSSVTLNATDTADGVRLISSSEEFYVKPNSGTFAASSHITALLVSQPTVSGTAIDPSKLNTVTTAVTLNGVAVPLGSTPANIITLTTANGDAKRVTLGAQVDVPTAARSQSGGDIRVTAAIRMSADLS
ncbi:hypothetical protein PQE20_15235 [Vibrio harveyi]|uniref:hypothetical protein n=1 Tax=Vibrio harveyi TaxID=669 RepID=UPI00234C9DFF|nr:hypothetical protein [Vibrio harveyi]WCP80137.1 hypothetical protein PQE20_15235 [Vibrio harveyi]